MLQDLISVGKKIYSVGSYTTKMVASKGALIGKTIFQNDGRDKLCKTVVNLIDLLTLGVAAPLPLELLRGRIKDFRALISGTELFLVGKGWIVKKEGTNKRFWQLKETSGFKIASKAFLTGGLLFETLFFLNKVEILNLGAISAKLGKLPVFNLLAKFPYSILSIIQQICFLFASTLGIVNTSIDISKSFAESKANKGKKDKWEGRCEDIKNAFKDPKEPDTKSLRDTLKMFYETKIASASLRKQELIWECLDLEELLDKAIVKVEISPEIKNNQNLLIPKLNEIIGQTEEILKQYPIDQSKAPEVRVVRGLQQKLETLIAGLNDLERLAKKQGCDTDVLTELNHKVNHIKVTLHNLNTKTYDVYAGKTSLSVVNSIALNQQGITDRIERIERKYESRLAVFGVLEQKTQKWQSLINAISSEDKIVLEEYKGYCTTYKMKKWEVKEENNSAQRTQHWFHLADLIGKLAIACMYSVLIFFPLAGIAFTIGKTLLIAAAAAVNIGLFAYEAAKSEPTKEPAKPNLSFVENEEIEDKPRQFSQGVPNTAATLIETLVTPGKAKAAKKAAKTFSDFLIASTPPATPGHQQVLYQLKTADVH